LFFEVQNFLLNGQIHRGLHGETPKWLGCYDMFSGETTKWKSWNIIGIQAASGG
jgi:hypothetical protein